MARDTLPPARRNGAAVRTTRATSPPPAPDDRPPSAKRRSYGACYRGYILDARIIPVEQRLQCNVDPRIALVNCRIGVDAVLADRATVEAHLPKVSYELAASCPDLARAVVFASNILPGATSADRGVRERVSELAVSRAEMRASVEGFVRRKLIPADAMPRLTRNKGMVGVPADALALHGVFAQYADRIAGVHPFTSEELARIADESEWLLETINPGGARSGAFDAKGATPMGDRDALWTMLVERHALLRRIGWYFHGENCDAVVPPLRSRTAAQSADDGEAPVDPPVDPPVGPA